MKINYFILIVITALIFSCKENTVTSLTIDISGKIPSTEPLNENFKSSIEGIYKIVAGGDDFGDYAVIKYTRNHLSIFCKKSTTYFILNSGQRDSVIYFNGFWRHAQGTVDGECNLSIDKKYSGKILGGKEFNKDNLILEGKFDFRGVIKDLKLQYVSPFDIQKEFYIIAHRGGERNFNNSQATENSLGIIKTAEFFGANAVEIDIQLTKDKIPILFHDDEFSSKIVNSTYLIGKVSDFSFEHIRTFGTLSNGEKIPSLDEALNIIVNETDLKLVWLDIKNAEVIKEIIPVIEKYYNLARIKKRDLKILTGIPGGEILNTYVKECPDRNIMPALCELDIEAVRVSGAKIWAPRWTETINQEQLKICKDGNIKIFVWTLDIYEVINNYLDNGIYDGILTDFPSIVAYEYLIQGRKK